MSADPGAAAVVASWLGERRKAVVAALTVLLAVLLDPSITGLLPESWGRWVTLLVLVANVLGVHQAANTTPAQGGTAPSWDELQQQQGASGDSGESPPAPGA